MTSYNEAGRAFWIEAYGGRPYRLERQKHPEPIEIAYFVVAVYGSTQPDKIAALMPKPGKLPLIASPSNSSNPYEKSGLGTGFEPRRQPRSGGRRR